MPLMLNSEEYVSLNDYDYNDLSDDELKEEFNSHEETYIEMLDDNNDPIVIRGKTYKASEVLKENDIDSYNEGFIETLPKGLKTHFKGFNQNG